MGPAGRGPSQWNRSSSCSLSPPLDPSSSLTLPSVSYPLSLTLTLTRTLPHPAVGETPRECVSLTPILTIMNVTSVYHSHPSSRS